MTEAILKSLEFQLPNKISTLGKIINLENQLKGFESVDVVEYPDIDFVAKGLTEGHFLSLYDEKRRLELLFHLLDASNYDGDFVTCRVDIVFDVPVVDDGFVLSDKQQQTRIKRKQNAIANLEEKIRSVFTDSFNLEETVSSIAV